jgi:hypothetical protein
MNSPSDSVTMLDLDGEPDLEAIGKAVADRSSYRPGSDRYTIVWLAAKAGARDYAKAHLSGPPAADGEWVLVPRVPTEAMIDAARNAPSHFNFATAAHTLYEAMLAAAPPAKQTGEGG